MAVLIVAGFHVPVIPLLDVVGKGGAIESRHSGPIFVNVGVTTGGGDTVTEVAGEVQPPFLAVTL